MITAIVYTSQTGHTKQYAGILGTKTGLPVYELKDAKSALPQGAEIIYLGWLMAGSVKGYAAAKKRFGVRAVCGVGMAPGPSQLEDIRKANRLPASLPVFSLQGGFEMDKLRGIYGFMMRMMKATVGKKIAEKEDRTPEENDMLDLMMNGGNRVSEENLAGILAWYKAESAK